jgi:hypothetical protein
LLVLLTILGGLTAWLFTYPSEASCQASGRILDLSRHYCMTDKGQVLTREHILEHATEPIICLPVALLAGVALLIAARKDRMVK